MARLKLHCSGAVRLIAIVGAAGIAFGALDVHAEDKKGGASGGATTRDRGENKGGGGFTIERGSGGKDAGTGTGGFPIFDQGGAGSTTRTQPSGPPTPVLPGAKGGTSGGLPNLTAPAGRVTTPFTPSPKQPIAGPPSIVNPGKGLGRKDAPQPATGGTSGSGGATTATQDQPDSETPADGPPSIGSDPGAVTPGTHEVGDANVTVGNGVVQIDTNGDGTPDVVLPESAYDAAAGTYTMPEVGDDVSLGDLDFFQGDVDGDGIPEVYVGVDSDGDGILDTYGQLGEGNSDTVAGLPQVDFDGQVAAGSAPPPPGSFGQGMQPGDTAGGPPSIGSDPGAVTPGTHEVGDANVTVGNGVVQIDTNGDGTPDVVLPESAYDAAAGTYTMPEVGDDVSLGDLDFFQGDVDGDGIPEVYVGVDSDGDGILDTYGQLGEGNSDTVAGLPQVDFDGQVAAGSAPPPPGSFGQGMQPGDTAGGPPSIGSDPGAVTPGTHEVGDANVTVGNGVVQIDTNGDGTPDVVLPESAYDAAAGTYTMPEVGDDVSLGDLDFFQGDVDGDGIPEVYVGVDSDGDGILDTYGQLGEGNSDTVAGLPQVDFDGQVAAGSAPPPPGSFGQGMQPGGDANGDGNGPPPTQVGEDPAGPPAGDTPPPPATGGNQGDIGNEPPPTQVGEEATGPPNGNTSPPPATGGNQDSGGLIGGIGNLIGGILDPPPAVQLPPVPTAPPAQVARRPPAGFDRRAITRQLTDLRAVWQKKLIGGKEYGDGQLRALAPLNRRNTDLQSSLRFLDQLGAAGLVTRNPYRIKRQELLAAGPATTPATVIRQAPPATTPADKPPNCSAVGGYSAYMKRTGAVCFCDRDPC